MKVIALETKPYSIYVEIMAGKDNDKILETFKPLSEFSGATQEIKSAENTLKANVAQLAKMAFAFLASGLRNTAAYAGMGDTEALAAFIRIPDKKNGLNRIMPVRNAFRVVEAGLLDEKVYDSVKTDTLVATGEIVKLVNYQLNHPVIADMIAVLNGTSESKAKEIRALKSRVKLDEKGVVTAYLSADEAKAESEKASKPTVLDAHEAASQLAKDNLPVLLAQMVATAKDTESEETANLIIRACAEAGFHLSARFGREKVNVVFAETVKSTGAAEKAATAGKKAGLNVKLVTA